MCITSWYPKINESHFGLPPSSIHKMTGVGGKMTYLHRPHFVLLPKHLPGLPFSLAMNFRLAATSSGSSGVRGFLSFDKQYVRRNLRILDLSTCTPGQTSPTVFIRLSGYIPRSATWQAEVSANDKEKPFSFDVDGPRKLAISKSSVETSVPCPPRRFSTGGPATSTFQANEKVLRGLQKQSLQEEQRKEQR